MDEPGFIAVYRPKLPYAKLRTYKILVDGVIAGGVREAKEVSFEVAPGKHVVQAKLDWCKSPPFDVVVRPGETVRLETTGNSFYAALFAAFLRPSQYVGLRLRD